MIHVEQFTHFIFFLFYFKILISIYCIRSGFDVALTYYKLIKKKKTETEAREVIHRKPTVTT